MELLWLVCKALQFLKLIYLVMNNFEIIFVRVITLSKLKALMIK